MLQNIAHLKTSLIKTKNLNKKMKNLVLLVCASGAILVLIKKNLIFNTKIISLSLLSLDGERKKKLKQIN